MEYHEEFQSAFERGDAMTQEPVQIDRGSQNERILEFLKAGNKLTPLLALDLFGTLRLSGRILELRNRGHAIKSEMVERNGRRVAEYRLERAA